MDQPSGLAPQNLNYSGFWVTPIGLSEEHSRTLQDIDGNPPFSQPLLYITEICLQVFDEQRNA